MIDAGKSAPDLRTIADTLQARAEADDPLAIAELKALAATLRSIATGNVVPLDAARRRVVREKVL